MRLKSNSAESDHADRTDHKTGITHLMKLHSQRHRGSRFTKLVAVAAVAAVALGGAASPADACADAMAKLYTGCDWVGARSRPLPAACSAVVQGTRKATQPCRSALECEHGLYCHGVSPTQTGKCGPPRPSGGACGRGIDPLTAYVGDNGALHPECEGVCANGKCRNLVAQGGACRASAARQLGARQAGAIPCILQNLLNGFHGETVPKTVHAARRSLELGPC